MKKTFLSVCSILLLISFSSFTNVKKSSQTKTAKSKILIDLELYIGDRIAIGDCNGGPAGVELAETAPGELFLFHLENGVSGYYTRIDAGNKITIVTDNKDVIEYFQCWVENDPMETVKFID